MALRDYMYAKHSNGDTDARINKVPTAVVVPGQRPPRLPKQGCHDVEDTVVCQNCADCKGDVKPKVTVEVDVPELNKKVEQLDIAESGFRASF